MRLVVRNSFARHTIMAERVRVVSQTCEFCGSQRRTPTRLWLYRFHVDDDQGARDSGPIAGGKLFCSRDCCESYTRQPFDETGRR
jgi:hypothetical protein